MACNVSHIFRCTSRLRPKTLLLVQFRNFSTSPRWKNPSSRSRRILLATLGIVAGATGAFVYILDSAVRASDLQLHPARYPWYHTLGLFNSLDHASIRRGYEVYKQICAACHSLQYVAYRDLVDVTHSESEAKKEAEEVTVLDGPDDTGAMYHRPGRLSDYIPSPYPNEQAARYANNGAFPPDLTYMVLARNGGENYVFSLLLGYMDPPAGVTLSEGQNYNPYFTGGAISMAQSVFDEVLEFQDGTPATASQIAKDVTTFLKWTSEPEFDERKMMVIRGLGVSVFLAVTVYYLLRFKWTVLRTRSIRYSPKK